MSDNEKLEALFVMAESSIESNKENTRRQKQAVDDLIDQDQELRRELGQVLKAIPGEIKKVINESLLPIHEEKKQRLKQLELEAIERVKAKTFWLWFFPIMLGVVTVGLFIILVYVQAPKYKAADKAYWENERMSLYGAQLVESDGNQFIVFDKDYEIGGCTKKNCVSIFSVKK